MAERGTQTVGTPRWVKLFGIIALVLVVLVVVMIVAGRGGHGPSRHTGDNTPSGDPAGHGALTGIHT